MQCPQCGASLREGAKFCNACGAGLETYKSTPQDEAPKSRFMRRVRELKWLIVAYVILSLCCMSGACLLGYRTQWILWKLELR